MRSSIRAAACAAVIVAGLAFAGEAQARERHVSGAWTTHRGTYTAHADVVHTRGFRSRDAVITGPNGGQRIVSDRRVWNRQAGTYRRDHVTRFADGTTRTLNVDAHRVAPGTWDYSRTVTSRNGHTRTVGGSVVVSKGP